MKNKVILLISPESWGNNFVSKHHYANYLSKNNKVYFLNPIVKSKFNPFGKIDVEFEQVSNNLKVVSYSNLLPKLNNLPKIIQKWIYKKQARQLRTEVNTKIDIVWSFDPNRFYNQRVWGVDNTIGHIVDCFNHNYSLKKFYSTSNLLIVISKHVKAYKHNNLYIIGHGFDSDVINCDKQILLPGSNQLKGMFIGNVTGVLDVERLNELAYDNDNVDFILIGPTGNSNLSSEKSNLASLNKKIAKNVYFLGEIKFDLIPYYLEKGDVNLLMIRKRIGVPNINSHKLMSYFNSGNVVVSDSLLDYKDFDEDLMVQCENSADFKLKFNQVIENIEKFNDESLKKRRKAYAQENEYIKKIEHITSLMHC